MLESHEILDKFKGRAEEMLAHMGATDQLRMKLERELQELQAAAHALKACRLGRPSEGAAVISNAG